MRSKPKISVIMSVYNGEKYLKYAIESILTQTFDNFEFIIVDDGSKDKSLEILAKYEDMDSRIKVIVNDYNIGLARSLNKALRQAKGKYIARQDADDISLSTRLEKQINYLEKFRDIPLVGTDAYIIDENGRIIGRKNVMPNPTFDDLLSKGNQFVHGTLVIRKKVLKKYGGYNERFKYSQDYELLLRLARKYTLKNIPEVLYKSRNHINRTTNKKIKKSLSYYFLAKKINKGDLPQDIIKKFDLHGRNIEEVYNYLGFLEKVRFQEILFLNRTRDLVNTAFGEKYKTFMLGVYYMIKEIFKT